MRAFVSAMLSACSYWAPAHSSTLPRYLQGLPPASLARWDKASESIGSQYASMTPYCPDKAHYSLLDKACPLV